MDEAKFSVPEITGSSVVGVLSSVDDVSYTEDSTSYNNALQINFFRNISALKFFNVIPLN